MAVVGLIRRGWQGGEDDFALPLGNIFSLEETCGAGLRAVHQRLLADTWGVRDIRETIRLGLIGGGMKPEDALRKVKAHVDGNPNGWAPSVLLAVAIIQAALFGGDEQLGKTAAPEDETGRASSTMTAASGAQPSTATAPE